LPIVLKPFGRVTVFEWRSMAFDEQSNDWPKIRDAKNAEVVKAFQNAHSQQRVDFVLGCLSGHNASPQTLYTIGESGTIIINFCWDDNLNFP
jgi:hypothetical protein